MEDAPTFDTARHAIGGNQPPPPTQFADETFAALSKWLLDHPAITADDVAREAKLFLDRANATLKDVEEARDREAKPLWQKWQDARARYAPSLDKLGELVKQLKARMTAWALAEEKRRNAEAKEAARVAEAARQAALEAERKEREAIENAAVGDFEADVGAAIATADDAFEAAKRAEHQAQIAERDSHVRIGGGFSRVSTLRTHKSIVIDDAVAAVTALWPNEKIRDAIISAARTHKTLHGTLPAGVHEVEEKRI